MNSSTNIMFEKCSFIKGTNIKHGPYIGYFDDNGKISIKGTYIKGNKEGYWEFFFENGHLLARGYFINGNKEGLWELFYKNGQLMAKENNLEDGICEFFYDDDDKQPFFRGEYIKGIKVGYWPDFS